MAEHTWTKYYKRLEAEVSTAVAGSPGLRSIGSLVIDSMIERLRAELIAELYSTHFPLIYQTRPSYAPRPDLPGIGGVRVESGSPVLPRVQLYYHPAPPLVITRGCHANFNGQYEVAEKVLDLYEELMVSRLIVVAGYGLEGENVCCAATNNSIIDELKKKYGVDPGYAGPFYGFSGVLFGMAKMRGLDAFCLFARTEPRPEDPESPDFKASKTLLAKLAQILGLDLDGGLDSG